MADSKDNDKNNDAVEDDGVYISIDEVRNDGKRATLLEKWRRNRKMRNTKLLFRAIDILFNLSQNTCPYVNKTNAGTVECTTDIVYDESVGKICSLDFYRPKDEGIHPAIILIHGGGFSAGDKKYRKGRAQFFALSGFCVFCVNYGLAPEFKFPQPLIHIVKAANFVYDNAERFGIDGSRIFVDGDSAGGYYAAMLAAFNGNGNFGEIFGCSPKFRIYGALLNCGVYDMATVLNTKYPFDLADGVILSLTGISAKDFEDYIYKDICEPIKFVTEDFPPTFVIYSDNDTFCKGQGNVMVDRLKENGVYCEYYCARHSSSNHCFSLTWSGEDAATANELMLSFAKRLADDKIKLS